MKKTLVGAFASVLAVPSLFAQGTDPGTLVSAELTTIAGYSATIIPAGLLIFVAIFGVRKVKAMGKAAS